MPDKPQAKTVELSQGEIDELCEQIPGPLVKRYGKGRLIDAEILRRQFRKFVGGCTVLNTERFLSICRRMDERYTALHIYQAILAYGNELVSSKFRQENPSARRSLESFLKCDRFDVYVAIGEQLLEDRDLAKYENTLRSLSAGESAALLADALRVLERSGPYKGDRKLTNPVIRREALRLLREFSRRKSQQEAQS